ncbi:hypothetical protein PoB_002415200 [Plakobranchus ocellatus]|uniref:Uncharacterized protein n=1 Tax=Plakobranchus ocellatus TaxID=259542 RepID=A0AAV3ZSN4_9GAST|nr:hypothetical protein PoB_002415200 [Plakobranchus ocellatus]
MSNSPHGVGNLARLPNEHTSGPNLNTTYKFGKISECAHKMSNSPHGVSNLARFRNMHTRCPTLNTGLEFGKTSECAHKMSNSQHRKGSFARLQNVHTRCHTLNMGYAIWQDFRMCTKEAIWPDFRMSTQAVQISKRHRNLERSPTLHSGRQIGKTSEYKHKRSNSQHGIGELAKLPNVHTRCPTLNTG